MESSSNQKSKDNNKNSEKDTASEHDIDVRKNTAVESDVSNENTRSGDTEEAPECSAATAVSTNELEANEASASLQFSYTSVNGNNVITSEKDINRTTKINTQKLAEITRKLGGIFSYTARQRPRQPFRPQHAQRLPPPPNYYSNVVNPSQRSEGVSEPANNVRPTPRGMTFHYELPRYVPLGQLAMFPTLFLQSARWAPYPSRIPGNIPASLALLLEAEVLFVIQQLDIIELITDFVEPNFYLIINNAGELLYYAYETVRMCACCFNSGSSQLHVMDMYQNEVIFLNIPCACTYFFCCYPVIEVYSPPTVPVGAVTKICNPTEERFVILDPDENVIFKIHGGRPIRFCTAVADFSIHALDSDETKVGFIRREYVAAAISTATNVDYYGLSFPENLDVRIKAVFLGALFLFDYMYFESNNQTNSGISTCCCCCCCCFCC